MNLIAEYPPVFQFVERHRLLVTAAPADLLDVVTLEGTVEDPWVSRAIRLRELPGRLPASMGHGNRHRNHVADGLRIGEHPWPR
jgi:hypothetical protein